MKKKVLILIFILLFTISFTGCSNKYEGYWCRYEETATIVVLMERNNTESMRSSVEELITTFEHIESNHYYTRQDYAEELGGNVDDLDIYDTYVLTFDSVDSISSYIEELSKKEGVKEAKQSNVKTNMELYHIEKNSKYTFTNSDVATEESLVKGKYKIKNGVITFTPEDKNEKTTMLYIKDGYLCNDADCKEIFAESNGSCNAN